MPDYRRQSTTKGFKTAAQLMQPRIRKATEARGFAVVRLLTHWTEIVGEGLAKAATPIKIGYGREGMGATLTLLTSGPHAPMVQAQSAQIRERVNACYGYNAVARVRITQTAPSGFAEAHAPFSGKPKSARTVKPEIRHTAEELSRDVESPDLRAALAALGANVLTKSKN